MQPVGRTPGKGERSRRELTEIAINCFSRFGFQGTSIDRIARDAGVTKGAIYYHFKDKDDLLALLVPAAPGALEAYPVSKAVSNVRNNGPELIAPLED